MNVADLVRQLGLQPHPEGGWFRETYRAAESIDVAALPRRFGGARSLSTAILFLLEAGQCSRLHRIQADEVWHFYAGDPLTVVEIDPAGRLRTTQLGGDLSQGAVFQHVVPAGAWFGATTAEGGRFTLVGCTVAPGFDLRRAQPGLRVAQKPSAPDCWPNIRRIGTGLPA